MYGSCAKDQSNANMLHVQRSNPMGTMEEYGMMLHVFHAKVIIKHA